jgi:hypothetical protein
LKKRKRKKKKFVLGHSGSVKEYSMRALNLIWHSLSHGSPRFGKERDTFSSAERERERERDVVGTRQDKSQNIIQD